LYLVSEFAKDYFHHTLTNTELGKAIGLSYFKERGFTDETVKEFQLGYSLDEWSAFTDHAIKKAYKLEFLEKTGLSIVKGEKQFDRFKGRVMFPIQSMSGRTLGFGGRILKTDKKAAKYLNSPESDIYHKSKVLYGVYHAKQSIAKEDNCFLVEGYTDVIQFYQRGVKNVVSSSGTALTSEQIRLINRLTKNITVLFDGDAAGLRASLRGIDLILEQGMNVHICTFPEGEDPDSFAKNNSLEDLNRFLEENAQDFIQFKASLLAADAKNDPLKKAQTIRDMVESIAKIPDVIKREVYIQECSRIMDISEDVLFNTLAQILQKDKRDANKDAEKGRASAPQPFDIVQTPKSKAKKVDVLWELERKIIELLLLYGEEEQEFEDLLLESNDEGEIILKPEMVKSKVFEKIFLDLQDDEVEFANNEFKEVYYDIIEHLNQKQEVQLTSFLNQLDPEKSSAISSILMEDEKYILHDWERKEIYVKKKSQGISQLVSETILNLRRHLISQKITELSTSVKENTNADTKEFMQSIMDYQGLKYVLAEKLRRVL
jgi:DNA primase